MLPLNEALTGTTACRIYRVDESATLDPGNLDAWKVQPIDGDVLEEEDGLFILRAFHVTGSGDVAECWIDLTMPERVADHVYFAEGELVRAEPIHECEGEVICAVPIDGFGQYDLFYSRTRPELGLSVLREGLQHAGRATFIAEDLGYILRDEGRLEEAIEAFLISASAGPSTYFIHLELAELYDALGRPDLAAEQRLRCPDQSSAPEKKPWWRIW